MRIMLGTKNLPSLLVEVDPDFNRNDFKFFAVNGCWYGHFINGHISTVGSPTGDFSFLNKREIINENQDRLRGEYNTVFAHFSDENYVAPFPKVYDFRDMDDDTPILKFQ